MVSDKNLVLYEILAVVEIVNIAASVLTNLLLIFLIFTRSSREIGAYRFFLFAFALNDIYFPVVHFLTLPVICSYKDAFLMFSHGILTSTLSICIFACAFSQTMPLLAHLFANCYFNYGSDTDMFEYVQPFLDEEFRGEKAEMIGALYYSTAGEFRMKAFLATMGFNGIMAISMFVIVFSSLSIVAHFRLNVLLCFRAIYYNYSMILHSCARDGRSALTPALFHPQFGESSSVSLGNPTSIAHLDHQEEDPGRIPIGSSDLRSRKASHKKAASSAHVEWSGATKKLQQQLFHTLVVQMIIPMVFVYFPCAAIINLPLMGFRINVFPNLVSAAVTIFPLIDAFVILFGVTSYRNAILVLLKCKSIPVVRIGSTMNAHTKETRSTLKNLGLRINSTMTAQTKETRSTFVNFGLLDS
ncbi:hypothetical protein PRIPAC_87889, partial [Pristionchus pacificus]